MHPHHLIEKAVEGIELVDFVAIESGIRFMRRTGKYPHVGEPPYVLEKMTILFLLKVIFNISEHILTFEFQFQQK